ncbi:MAG TPA: FG-GAP-like repeat-containing protein [Candidatus Aquilonibacter sp.]|nr:FG-GAP-like repeat-containing protein [Candidatus Aquilonibacter sp.]
MVLSRKVLSASSLAACVLVLAAAAAAQLETRDSFATADVPLSIVVGDFNHDGIMDVVTASTAGPEGAEVQVFLGNGNGTFGAPTVYGVGQETGPIAVADVNGDGNLDLVVVNGACPNFVCDDSVSVLLGNGDGTFQPPMTFSTPPGPYDVVLGDFNNDGVLDIATINQADYTTECDCVSVLLGNGDGTFQEPPIISYPPFSEPEVLLAGNFVKASKNLDLALGLDFESSGSVQILLGNGDGTFTLGDAYGVAPEPQSITAADFRNDGRTDLAVGEFGGRGVGVLLGNGDGTFQQPVVYDAYFPLGVAVGDINGDGIPDIVAAALTKTGQSGLVDVFLGNGNGTFKTAQQYPAGEFPTAVALADFNNDHLLDVAITDQFGDAGIVLLNTGVVGFAPSSPITFPTQLVGTTSGPLSANLINKGTSPLEISSVTLQGKPFTMQTTCGKSVAPKGTCSITATFTPEEQGITSGTVTIKDSASSKPMVVELVGTGTVVGFTPSELTFGPQTVGTASAPQTIQVTNTGSTVLKFTYSFYVGGKDYNDFSDTTGCTQTLNSGFLKPGASCSINVTFKPTETGARSATVVVTDTGGGSPQMVPLSGTGD